MLLGERMGILPSTLLCRSTHLETSLGQATAEHAALQDLLLSKSPDIWRALPKLHREWKATRFSEFRTRKT
ncbi:hypothetical protein CDV31_012040 [Fusarium ambrosium]|uniref:Uncharacterized protein n=1 Tax=Fusarium ambrosium TaxID=131363 RepID=A0A428TCM2_9HYPO|nr:hypothetical protein CDV31_012040 [Fusarium ambrosium]